MHDIKYIRSHPDAFDAQLAKRGVAPVSSDILEIDRERRQLIHKAEEAKAAQNAASKEVGAAKARGDDAAFERLRALVTEKKSEVAELEAEAKARDADLQNLLMTIPNLPFDDVPVGEDENDNVEIHRWGTPKDFDFAPKEHFEIGSVAPLFNFDRAGKLSGTRFVILTGALARLQRAIAQFMIDLHVDEHGLEEVWTPVLVKDEALYGTGQLPKFTEDLYQTREGWWLIPTAEVTLTNLSAGDIVEEASLPRQMTAYTQCFRSEAGSAGRDTAGMLRQHQFEKVEMVSITKPDQSSQELEDMLKRAEAILERLELPYRTVVLCTGDMGFGARKTYDIEVWLPGQNTYREISSCSNCGDFQARRMNTRFRDKDGNLDFIHSLNGSGLAVGRCLIAVLENGQQEDGSVNLPLALAPYLGGKRKISAEGKLV